MALNRAGSAAEANLPTNRWAKTFWITLKRRHNIHGVRSAFSHVSSAATESLAPVKDGDVMGCTERAVVMSWRSAETSQSAGRTVTLPAKPVPLRVVSVCFVKVVARKLSASGYSRHVCSPDLHFVTTHYFCCCTQIGCAWRCRRWWSCKIHRLAIV